MNIFLRQLLFLDYLSSRKVFIIMIATLISNFWCSTCPSSNTNLNSITTSQWIFTGFRNTRIYAVAAGPITNCLHFVYFINSPSQTAVIRKFKTDNSIFLMFAISFLSSLESLWVDINEQLAYLTAVQIIWMCASWEQKTERLKNERHCNNINCFIFSLTYF